MSAIRIAHCHLKSMSPYSQGNFFTTTRPTQMKADEFEKLNWRERAHTVKAGPDLGKMYIPAQQFKNAVWDVAKFLGMKIRGKGNSTYGKHFAAGVMVQNDVILPVKVSDLEPEIVWVSADGTPGGSTKVQRYFPVVQEWEGQVDFILVDETIDNAIFEEHLKHAGNLIGIGRWRPIKNGRYGRFKVENCEFENITGE